MNAALNTADIICLCGNPLIFGGAQCQCRQPPEVVMAQTAWPCDESGREVFSNAGSSPAPVVPQGDAAGSGIGVLTVPQGHLR